MTKEELKALSDQTFIDNNLGQIVPEGHRNFNNKLLDFIGVEIKKVDDKIGEIGAALDTINREVI